MRRFSPRAAAVLASAPLAPRACSPADGPLPVRPLLSALFEATGRRGLPVVCGYVFGEPPAPADTGAPPPDHEGPDGTRHVLFASAAHRPFWAPPPASPPRFTQVTPFGAALYVGAEGSISDLSGDLVGCDPWAFIERLALLAGGEWLPVRAILPDRLPVVSHGMLGLTKVPEASDAWFSAWTGPGLVLPSWEQACFRSFEAVLRFLAACAAGRANVTFEATAGLDVEASEPAPAGDLPARSPHAVQGIGCRLWTIRVPDGPLEQSEVRGDVRIARQELAASGSRLWQTPLPEPLLERLSPRCREYLAAHAARLDPVLRLSFEQLARELEARGLPFEDGWFDFEEELGGLEWDQSTSTVGLVLGAGLFFAAGPDDPLWGRDGIGDQDIEVVAAEWPVVSSGGERLLMAGAAGHPQERLFVDGRGALWRGDPRGGAPRRVASCGRALLEKEAALWDARRRTGRGAAAEIPSFDPGLPEALGLPLVEEASDELSSVYGGEDLWIWQFPAGSTSPGATRILGRTTERVAAAVARLTGREG